MCYLLVTDLGNARGPRAGLAQADAAGGARLHRAAAEPRRQPVRNKCAARSRLGLRAAASADAAAAAAPDGPAAVAPGRAGARGRDSPSCPPSRPSGRAFRRREGRKKPS